ncbi:hypothetical protein HK105_201069 [Polyrhizophydium stewartii]|uniref:Transmembrane protein n=1 Tax=Polyrhizophydium stewartii TaxID=2732419 RepID=A0ABR4NIY1_9FUNG
MIPLGCPSDIFFKRGGLNNGRLFTAHLTYSIIMVGLGLQDVVKSLFLIVSSRKAWNTTLFRLAAINWIFVLSYVVVLLVFLDLHISLYSVDIIWYKQRFIFWMCASALTSVTLYTIMLMRVRLLFDRTSAGFVPLVILGVITMLCSLAFSAAGIHRAIEYTGSINDAEDALNDTLVNLLGGVSRAAQGIFTSSCSILFLHSISKAFGLSKLDLFSEIFTRSDGFRFLLIISLCMFAAATQIYQTIKGPQNYIVYLSTYTDSWLFPLELYTFLSTSYVSAKDLVVKAKEIADRTKSSTNDSKSVPGIRVNTAVPPLPNEGYPVIVARSGSVKAANYRPSDGFDDNSGSPSGSARPLHISTAVGQGDPRMPQASPAAPRSPAPRSPGSPVAGTGAAYRVYDDAMSYDPPVFGQAASSDEIDDAQYFAVPLRTGQTSRVGAHAGTQEIRDTMQTQGTAEYAIVSAYAADPDPLPEMPAMRVPEPPRSPAAAHPGAIPATSPLAYGAAKPSASASADGSRTVAAIASQALPVDERRESKPLPHRPFSMFTDTDSVSTDPIPLMPMPPPGQSTPLMRQLSGSQRSQQADTFAGAEPRYVTHQPPKPQQSQRQRQRRPTITNPDGIPLTQIASRGRHVALFLLTNRKTWGTPLVKAAIVCWAAIVVQLSCFMVLFDWRISPFAITQDWYLARFIALVLGNIVSGVCLWSILIARMGIVFPTRSFGFIISAVLGCLTIAGNIAFGYVAVRACVDGLANIANITQTHDLLKDPFVSAIMAGYHAIMAVFSITCSVMFLYSIAKSVGIKDSTFATEMAEYEAMTPNSNFVSYTSLYIDAWLYPLQLSAFLLTSYVSPRQLVAQHAKSRSGGSGPSVAAGRNGLTAGAPSHAGAYTGRVRFEDVGGAKAATAPKGGVSGSLGDKISSRASETATYGSHAGVHYEAHSVAAPSTAFRPDSFFNQHSFASY